MNHSLTFIRSKQSRICNFPACVLTHTYTHTRYFNMNLRWNRPHALRPVEDYARSAEPPSTTLSTTMTDSEKATIEADDTGSGVSKHHFVTFPPSTGVKSASSVRTSQQIANKVQRLLASKGLATIKRHLVAKGSTSRITTKKNKKKKTKRTTATTKRRNPSQKSAKGARSKKAATVSRRRRQRRRRQHGHTGKGLSNENPHQLLGSLNSSGRRLDIFD